MSRPDAVEERDDAIGEGVALKKDDIDRDVGHRSGGLGVHLEDGGEFREDVAEAVGVFARACKHGYGDHGWVAANARTAAWTGSLRVKDVPCSLSDSSVILPACSSAMV